MNETRTAAATKAAEIAEIARVNGVSILADLAEYIGDTAGDLSPKALDEIAHAYLAGGRDALARGDTTAASRRARRLAGPILRDINRRA